MLRLCRLAYSSAQRQVVQTVFFHHNFHVLTSTIVERLDVLGMHSKVLVAWGGVAPVGGVEVCLYTDSNEAKSRHSLFAFGFIYLSSSFSGY